MLINAFPQAKADRQQVTEEITASGTWTVPEGVTRIHVMCFGGGGGGNDTCGGGGGYLAQGDLDVTPGAQYAITIGTGGAAKNAGGATSFGTLLSANGGGAPTTHTTGSTSPKRPGRAGSGGTGGGGYGRSESSSTSYDMFYPSGSGQYGGDGGMVSCYGASDGSGTATANGGASYYTNSYSNSTYYTYAYAGGGGGMNGGNGGSGNGAGGGGGGYGSTKFATNGKNGSTTQGYGGFGYGAGGGGGTTPGKGAQGICVIQYNKA